MPVQWRPYQSMYVSQRSPEIAKILRDRFANNFAAQDEVKQKLLELQAAPFEGDQAAKNALDASIQQRLNAFSERGDYENMTMDVARLARDYQNQSYPLMRNQQLYAQDLEEKSEMLQKGVITTDMYNNWLKSTQYRYDSQENDYKPYSGVQLGPDNKPDPTSFYQPTQVAAFVDVQGEILKQLNQLDQVKSGGNTVSRYETRDGGVEYYIEDRTGTVEKVPEELVRQVTEGVLRRSDVQSYMQQDARFKTIGTGEGAINQTIQDRINMLRSVGSPEAAGRASELERVMMEGTPGEKRQAAEQSLYDTEYQRLHSMGLNARTPSVYGALHTEEYSKKYLAGLKESTEVITPPDPALLFPGIPEAFHSPFVDPSTKTATNQSIDLGVRSAQTSQAIAVQTLQESIPGFDSLDSEAVFQTLLNSSPADLIAFAQDNNLATRDLQLLENARSNVQKQQSIIEAATRTREMVYAETGFTPPVVASYVASELSIDMGIEAGELVDTFADMLDGANPDLAAKAIVQNVFGFNPVATPGGDRIQAATALIQKVVGYSPEEAERIVIETFSEPMTKSVEQRSASSTLGVDPLQPGAYRGAYVDVPTISINRNIDAFAKDVANIYKETASARNVSYNDLINEAFSGGYQFDRVEFAPGTDESKLLKEVRKHFIGGEGRNPLKLTDLSSIAGLNGQAIDRIVADQIGVDYDSELLSNMEVDNIYLTRAFQQDGTVGPAMELSFTAPKGTDLKVASDSKSIKVPLESVVTYAPGLAEAIQGQFNTPAEKVINEVLTTFYHAPMYVSRNGAEHNYRDNKGNAFTFRFVPTIGQNNVVTGFERIEYSGYSAMKGGYVRGVYTSEEEFISSFNILTRSAS